MKTKLIPFDVEKAKAGAKVVTRCGYPVRMSDFDVEDKDGYKLLGIIDINGNEVPYSFKETGCRIGPEIKRDYDLFIEEEVKTRRMTNQELSWWLDGPLEEHREYIRTSWIYRRYSYLNGEANKPVEADIYIRKNGGEWQEPLVEI